jgi:plastocyanin
MSLPLTKIVSLSALALVLGAAPVNATTIVVTASGFSFTPANITIQVGDTVRWQRVTLSHTVTEGTDGTVDGDETFHAILDGLNPIYELTFDAAFVSANPRPGGLYDYFCEPHFPPMVGTIQVVPVGTSFCAGDGTTATPCPCGNTGAAGKGCENSAGTGGARLVAHGSSGDDAVVLTSSGELSNALSIFLQGNATNANGTPFGDGVRCVAGSLKRIAVNNATNGEAYYPHPGEDSIGARSAALGDPIAPGSTRWYQTYYRDPNLAFCAAPTGSSFNVSNGITIVW